MRTLPDNVSVHPDGYLVRVMRHGVLFQAFVPGSHAAPLERAIELRDRFLQLAGGSRHPKSRRPHRVAYSNTEITGISETVTWRGYRSYNCFNVSWSVEGKQHQKRFLFGRGVERATALQAAIKHRRQMTGQEVVCG